MADRDQLYTALRNADAAGDVEGARKLAAYIKSMPADAAPAKPETTIGQDIAAGAKNAAAGFGRGLKDVVDTGAQLLSSGFDKLAGTNEGDRVRQMNQAGQDEFKRDYGDSTAASIGRVGGNIAATLPIGPALGAVVRTVAPAAAPLANALATSGMRAGATPGVGNMLLRMAGGAGTGAVSAGLVNPEDTGTGAVVGALLPPALAGAGKVGAKIGQVIAGPGVSNETRAAVSAARDAGYVIPPSQANPTLLNNAVEGFAGKVSTAQKASVRNQTVTNDLVKRDLGLAADQPITVDALKAIRQDAGQAYDAVAGAGTITPTQAYGDALDKIVAPFQKASQGFPNAKPSPIISEIESLRSPQFDADSALAKIKELRGMADSAYAKGDKDMGKALKAGAGALEDAIDTHLQSIGAPADLINNFRNARQTIAKTYSVESALNAESGNVSAAKLAAQLKKGRPLSGETRDAAEFASRFPKAAQNVENIGSTPGVSPLDYFGAGTASITTGNPLAMLGVVARPLARSAALSGPIQNRLAQAQQAPGFVNRLASSPELQQLLYRAAPLQVNGR
ncbi:hypothetical protein [Herbaspirillum aquaticum]|uniref:Uncharacterized protein n=1 Tax=Herbaspirillum aquaticum TaxID=568783 RepID=A0A225STW2_9BURK|nr:hypothetical protein [Herbaspirillum aquaticum]OWY32863.1 hypothetical protein CEJ45_19395 [Herbaspirillum aquaticum]